MNAYTEFMEKAQAEFLNSVKQAQDLNLQTFAAMTNLVAAVPAPDAKDLQSMAMPNASDLVEQGFAFSNDLLAMRKNYMVKLADLATEASKTFTETAKRMADQAKSVDTTVVNAAKNGMTAPGAPVSSHN